MLPLCVYVASARRDVWFWDTGEMDTVPWILGIAHPTGFPAYVLAGYAFSHLFPFGPVAFRMSVMSACAMAAAAYFVYRTVRNEGWNAWIAAASAWLFAFGAIVWTRGTRAEVHALAVCAFAAMLFFVLRWQRHGRRRDLVAGAIAWGAGLAVHPLLLLALPAVVFVVLLRRGPIRVRDMLTAAGCGVAAAAVWFAYLPLRSLYVTAHALDPTRSIGIGPGQPFWDYDHPATLHGFAALATGGDFDLSGIAHRMLSSGTGIPGLLAYGGELLHEVTPVGVAVVVAGVLVAWMRNRERAAALLLFATPCVIVAAGFPPESDPQRYLLESFAVAAVFAGDAMGFVAQRLQGRYVLAPVALAAIALVLLVENRWIFAQAGDERARAVIADVQAHTPANAILVSNWLDGPPLAYAAYVEHGLQSRIVAIAWVGDLGARAGTWLRSRPVFVVGTSNAGGLQGYRLVAVSRGSQLYRLTR